MKLGINTYTYMWSIGFKIGDREVKPARPMSALDLLGKAHELGVRVVQIGPNLPLDKLSEAELDAFVRQARAWHIELELGTRGLETAHLLRQLMLAKRIGARLLRTIPETRRPGGRDEGDPRHSARHPACACGRRHRAGDGEWQSSRSGTSLGH